MKRYFQFLILIVATFTTTSVAYAQTKMVITMNDGETHEYSIKDVAKMSWEEENDPNGGSSDETPQTNNHEYVDLGLPSGTLWATCNVGANSPEEYGDYFAWGETEPKDYYYWGTYKWSIDIDNYITKYCTDAQYGEVDGKRVLDLEDDAARANWGGDWRMPTVDDWNELMEYCYWTWTTLNGVNGYRVKSMSYGNYIFLPAADARNSDLSYKTGSIGRYWSSSLCNTYQAYYLYFYNDPHYAGRCFVYDHARENGLPIRPILSSAPNSQP